MIDNVVRIGMIRRLGEEPWERYYRPRNSIPTLKEGSAKEPSVGVSASQNAAPPAESVPLGVRFVSPPPPSVSLSAIHRLPGQGFIPDTRSAASIIGGPSVM
jgi:hypothetical protein